MSKIQNKSLSSYKSSPLISKFQKPFFSTNKSSGVLKYSELRLIKRIVEIFSSHKTINENISPDISQYPPNINVDICYITNLDNIEVPRSLYNLRSRTIGDLRAFIAKIISCIDQFLRGNNKKIIHITQGDKQAYVIVDDGIDESSWTPNKNDAQVTFSVSNIDKDDINTHSQKYKFRSNQIRQTLLDSQTIKQLHIGWVNGMAPGSQQRMPGLGLLILFYAILQSFLQHDFLIKGSLDNDSNYNDTYYVLGFTYDSGVHDNTFAPEMSSSLNIEKIINDILPVICGMHPQICDCIYSTAGGKRRTKKRTKKRKSKRRKTRRRRKY